MSEGPIKAWRDAHKLPRVSTPDNQRICGITKYGTAYCGRRRNAGVSTNWASVTCADCHAAREADRIAAGTESNRGR